MVATNMRAEAVALMDRRRAIEAEIEVISEQLNGPGGPGLTGNLVDKEGFPRADIDVHAVRVQRNRLAVLHTDHKEITLQIERYLHELLPPDRSSDEAGSSVQTRPFASSGAPTTARQHAPAVPFGPVTMGSEPMQEDYRPPVLIRPRPFAVIDEISDGSPAAEDGIRLRDELLQFGSVTGGRDCVQQVAKELQASVGSQMRVKVLRYGAELDLVVTPRAWGGRGLLGCHMQPL